MNEAQAAARLQQKVEELSAASIRALADERDLHFRGHRLHRGVHALPLFAPHLHPSLEHDDAASFRGAADGLALRLRLSDAALHASLAPAAAGDATERFLFDWLEQFRVESLVPPSLPGARRNLADRHAAWSRHFHEAGHTEGAVGLLLFTVAQVCRARVTGDAMQEDLEDLLESTRAGLAPRIGHALVGLRRERADQAAYSVHALAIARVVAELVRDAGRGQAAKPLARPDEPLANLFGMLVEPDGATSERFATAVSSRRRSVDGEGADYRVFTTAYDREDAATALVRATVLAAMRERLDTLVAARGINRSRLVRELHALFDRPMRDGWDGGREEGLVDGRRLAALVASPGERRLFRQERIEPRADCVVAVLVDCSGSMKEHAEAVAVIADTLMRALEEAGAAAELLGFTTAAWNGGRARRDWLRAGRPTAPGRLNERQHIVFKAADTPWRRGRAGIAALLRGELFREGIDGEAVDWACARLAGRDEARKLLLVISDGAPMDTATRLANDALLLDRHLRSVVRRHERTGLVEIVGVGVGLDLSAAYSRSHVLDLGGAPGNRVFREIVDLVAGRVRR